MSIEATLATWKLTKEQVSSSEKLFLLSCANRAGESHECWPSLKRLSADTGLDRKTLIKVRQELIEKGLLEYTGACIGRSNQIPVMRLSYVDHSVSEFTSPKIGTGTSTKNGTGTSPKIGTLNLKEESISGNNYIYTREPNFDDEATGLKIQPLENHAPENPASGEYTPKQPPAIEPPKPPTKLKPVEYKETYYPIEQSNQTISNQLMPKTTSLKLTYNLTDKDLQTFEAFWSLYPVRTNKIKCQNEWFSQGLHRFAEEIIKKLSEQVKLDKRFKSIDYTPAPLNWLRGQQWNDEIVISPKTNGIGGFNTKDTSWASPDKFGLLD